MDTKNLLRILLKMSYKERLEANKKLTDEMVKDDCYARTKD